MLKKYLLSAGVFILAIAILTISVMRSATATYVFATPAPSGTAVLGEKTQEIEYGLPYPGGVLPNSPLWSLKALRDKVWYAVTANPLKKAELALLFSDKRLGASITLFDLKKPEVALSTLSKGEKYLETAAQEEKIARSEGYDTSSFLLKLATASLKHRQLIEGKIIPGAPASANPDIVKIEDYAKNSYKSARDGLNDKSLLSPIDPFDGQ